MRSNLITDYLLPVRIVDKSANVLNSEILLKQECSQVYIGKQECCSIKGPGFIVLDFGKELAGGLRILASRFEDGINGKIRIRFGESVSECYSNIGEKNATNHHSVRDFEINLPNLSDQTFGNTGFRFVRIDFFDECTYKFVNFYAAYSRRDIQQVGSFKCDDELLNQIYNTCVHTLELNLQENIFEGVKRDRLVWIGDLQPELLAFSYLYSDYKIIENAIADSIRFNPLPCWFGNIPTYSLWLIEILRIYLVKTENKDFVNKQMDYVEGVINQLDKCVLNDGVIDFSKCSADFREGFFFDWPSNGTIDAIEGNRYVFIYCLNSYKQLMKLLGKEPSLVADKMIAKLSQNKKTKLTYKQAIALGNLVGVVNNEEASKLLFEGGAKGLSTFFSYFTFKAMAKSNNTKDTLSILKEYYGGMLSRGATSFWEDFNVEWLEGSGRIDELTPANLKDLHGDFGGWCYKGFRHSLCHGWSVGPVAFLIEEVAGIQLSNDEFNKVSIKPNLSGLKNLEVVIPTKYGSLEVTEKDVDGKTIVLYKCPKELKVEVVND